MGFRRQFGLVSVFSIATLVLFGSGSPSFGGTVLTSSVEQPVEISAALVATHEALLFESVPLRAPINSHVRGTSMVTLATTLSPPDIFGITLVSSNWGSQPSVEGVFPGDVSGDTWVDNQDIAVISAHWLETGAPSPTGDANADNAVNIFDVNVVSANWNPQPIPEPTSAVLLALAAPGLWWIRRAMRR